MKKLVAVLILICLCLVISSGIFLFLFLQEKEKNQSLAAPQVPTETAGGNPANAAMAQMNAARQSAQDWDRTSAKAASDFQTAMQSTGVAVNAAAEQATRDFKVALQGALASASRELEKYNEALKKNQERQKAP